MSSKLRAVGLVAGVVLAATSAVTGTASATSNDQTMVINGEIELPPENLPDSHGFVPNFEWKVGDCWMLRGGYVTLVTNHVRLHGVTATDFTSGADIWHSDFEFDDENGAVLYRAGGSAFDSPDMIPLAGRGHSGPSGTYRWTKDVTVNVPANLYLFVKSVKWRSRC